MKKMVSRVRRNIDISLIRESTSKDLENQYILTVSGIELLNQYPIN